MHSGALGGMAPPPLPPPPAPAAMHVEARACVSPGYPGSSLYIVTPPGLMPVCQETICAHACGISLAHGETTGAHPCGSYTKEATLKQPAPVAMHAG
eukprot:1156686-Pelagomonas_calceolata.AAC.5